MPFGLISPVVMEFPGITAGGGFAGTSGESSSFRHGFFNETVNFVEMILGNGDKIRASREEHEDLFHGAAGAAGTLGCRTPTFHPVTKGSSDTGTGDNMSQPMLNIGV
ncbi:Delta(24)-sterol reductase [Fusarium oxysporum f. sp. conglutinans]|nr:Delta(24)-sterol reductase [Fusarium oxysporum f. sp. conglutinans]